MTLKEFYKYACLAGRHLGYEKPEIIVQSGIHNGDYWHSAKLWDKDRHKYINGKMSKNPVAAIRSFKDAIKFDKLRYSDQVEDIEL